MSILFKVKKGHEVKGATEGGPRSCEKNLQFDESALLMFWNAYIEFTFEERTHVMSAGASEHGAHACAA